MSDILSVAQFACIAGTNRKGVSNAERALKHRLPRSREAAGILGLAREIASATGIPLVDAWAAAGAALQDGSSASRVLSLPGSPAGLVTASIDLVRYRTALDLRIATARERFPARARGRPAARPDSALDRASAAGIDLRLLVALDGLALDSRQQALRDHLAWVKAGGRRLEPGLSGLGDPDLLDLLREAALARLHVVLVGGVAAALHGASHLATSLEFCCDPSNETAARLAARLARWRAVGPGAGASTAGTIDGAMLHSLPTLTIDTNAGRLTLLHVVPGIGGYDEVLRRSEAVELSGAPVRLLRLGALIDATRATGLASQQQLLLELAALRDLRDTRRARS